MRKTILTTATLLGVAPAALAAGGPLSVPAEPSGSVGASPTKPAQLGAAKAHRELHTPGWRARAATAERRRRARARQSERGSSASPQLQAIAQRESGGNPSAVGGGGQFRGKYQFTYATWTALGGSGDPASAPEVEQDRRAAQLLASSGTGQWPNCG